MLVCALLVHIAHEIAGAARIRHSLRPLSFEGEGYLQSSGAMRRENEKSRFVVIASEAKQSIARRNESMDCFVAYAPVRKRFAFVAGNDGSGSLKFE